MAADWDFVTLTFTLYADLKIYGDSDISLLASDFLGKFLNRYQFRVKAIPNLPIRESTYEGKETYAVDFDLRVGRKELESRGYNFFEQPIKDIMSDLLKERYVGIKVPSETSEKIALANQESNPQ